MVFSGRRRPRTASRATSVGRRHIGIPPARRLGAARAVEVETPALCAFLRGTARRRRQRAHHSVVGTGRGERGHAPDAADVGDFRRVEPMVRGGRAEAHAAVGRRHHGGAGAPAAHGAGT